MVCLPLEVGGKKGRAGTVKQRLLQGIISKSTGESTLYGEKTAQFLGINHITIKHLDKPIDLSQLSIAYTVSATPAQAQILSLRENIR
jgi:hypothetical protein